MIHLEFNGDSQLVMVKRRIDCYKPDQAQAGCAGYGKGVCGLLMTPTAPTGQGRDQVTVFINGSNVVSSGSFSVASARLRRALS